MVGAGILGLATARELARRLPGIELTVIDKETSIAAHQTGHNSGVVHAGVYYPPGSLKATLCRRGSQLLRDYCAARQLPFKELGKLVIASTREEIPALMTIRDRAIANAVPDVAVLTRSELRAVEPDAEGLAAVHSPHTAVVDYVAIARRLADDIRESGGRVLLGRPVTGLRDHGDRVTVAVGRGEGPEPEHISADLVVCCAGLGTDAVARMAGASPEPRIIPFRGEYYRLAPVAAQRVRGLIYPVPDPRYPFLGVHFTRGVDDEVMVGPNAVLALAVEGYRRRDVDLRDLRRILAWPGTWRMAGRYWQTGLQEVWGSLSRRAYAGRARRYLPALRTEDLAPAGSGVRAQAIDRRGGLVDDFIIQRTGQMLLVRNAPSPAATSSLAIAELIVDAALGEARSQLARA